MGILEYKGVTKNYGSKRAVDNVDLSLEPGKIVGLLGPNGAGKTTMIKMAAGLVSASQGDVLVDGIHPGAETKEHVAYLSDRVIFPEYMTAGEMVRMYGDFFKDFNKEKAVDMLLSLGIRNNMKLREMSKGTKEKLQLVLVMSRQAEVYLLDEPIGGVDPAARDYILQTIITNYSPEALVVISTHLIGEVESVLDDVVFIKEGKILLNRNADELREEKGVSVEELFKEVFKC